MRKYIPLILIISCAHQKVPPINENQIILAMSEAIKTHISTELQVNKTFYAGRVMAPLVHAEPFIILKQDHYEDILKPQIAREASKNSCHGAKQFGYPLKSLVKQNNKNVTLGRVLIIEITCDAFRNAKNIASNTLTVVDKGFYPFEDIDSAIKSTYWIGFEKSIDYYEADPLKKWRNNKKVVTAVNNKSIYVGMPEEALPLAVGDPTTINTSTFSHGTQKQYIFGTSTYIYVKNGFVSSWQTSE